MKKRTFFIKNLCDNRRIRTYEDMIQWISSHPLGQVAIYRFLNRKQKPNEGLEPSTSRLLQLLRIEVLRSIQLSQLGIKGTKVTIKYHQ